MKQLKNQASKSVIGTLRRKVRGQAATIRKQACEIKKWKRLSFYDELTEILNRRGGIEEISLVTAELRSLKEDGEMRKNKQPRSIVIGLFDIDRFKGINDKFGHKAGDAVIKKTAEFLENEFREYDVICRWGGEEFLVAFQGDEWDLLKKTFGFNVKSGKQNIRVTLSGGVTNYRRGEELYEAVERADAAMYRSKEMGRNRITVHGQ
ncbi:MAG TPA: GGDEF domain-containing protein [Candidatus Paceibacterota bacterium]|nr:GGDEF domain-containing protein [Candidatus Paceibacterota bacterium]